jgi:L,D-transpeptidase ErfK/SrfK
MSTPTQGLSRRRFWQAAGMAGAGVALGGLAAPALAREQALRDVVPDGEDPVLRRRISGLVARDWREHFDSIERDAILCDTVDRVLHYWGADGFYRIYPTAVPLSDELTRRGRTEIVLKRPAPDWRPTPNMLKRNPDLPRYVGPGPDNPLGVRALNLTWQYYLIHGTNDIRKIGRQSSNGCIGLFNEHVVEIYERAKVGTPVALI